MAHTILIVDDDPATREGLALLLTETGYQALTASTVPAALQVLAERHPDLLIADVRLDAYNGLHLVAMAPRPIPAIIVTGFPDPSIEVDARRLGADFLIKPVIPSTLLDLIARKLASAAPERVFTDTRRAPRKPVTTGIAVRVGQETARVLDVSESGVRLEVQSAASAGGPTSLTLVFVESGVSVPVDVVWKRQTDEMTWVCGATIVRGVESQWRTLVGSL